MNEIENNLLHQVHVSKLCDGHIQPVVLLFGGERFTFYSQDIQLATELEKEL